MKTKNVPGFTAFLCLVGSLAAQPLLTPEDAVHIALQNNFSLSLAKDQTAEATINRQTGIGSFLPNVSANVTAQGAVTDTTPHPLTTVGASLSWQIFDGFQSYNAYQGLKSTEKAAQLQERLTVESTLESVLNGYYGVVLQKQLLTAISEALGVAEDEAKLARANTRVGTGSQLDELTAIATLNEDSSSLLSQENALRQAKIQLNQLLARDPNSEFEVMDSIPLDEGLSVENWRTLLEDNNASILQAKAQQNSAASSLREAKGRWFPTLTAGLGYSAVPSALNTSSTLNSDFYKQNSLNQSGNYSLSLSIPIFDQLQTPQGVRIARLQLRQGETQLRLTEETILGQFDLDLQQYNSGLQQVALEARNLAVAKKQADAAFEQYKVGTITALALRDAQSLLLNARSTLFTAYQNTKQAEIVLKGLAGFLVRETPAQAENP